MVDVNATKQIWRFSAPDGAPHDTGFHLTRNAGEPTSSDADGSLLHIPRAPVFGTTTLAGKDSASSWPRVDRQGPCVYTTNGRAGILLGLRAFGIGAGDRVLVPTYHCPTMIEPVVLLGAEPLFYPIGSRGEPNLEFLAHCDLRQVKALLVAHLFGIPQSLAALRAFCDVHHITLVEDCAHAFFGESPDGLPVGATGDMAIASLPKFFPAVEGGCLVIKDGGPTLPDLLPSPLTVELRAAWDTIELGAAAGRLGGWGRAVSALARLKNLLRGRGIRKWEATLTEPDLASACHTIDHARAHTHAAAVVRWMAHRADVEAIAEARRANYREFARSLSSHARMRPLFPDLPLRAVPYVFPLEVDEPEAVYRALRRRGVPLFRWDLAWPGTPALPGDAGASWSTRVLQLSCHQDMTLSDIRTIAGVIQEQVDREHQ